MKRLMRTIMICLLMAAVVISMTGCKEALSITQVLYDQKQEEVDENNETKITEENPDTGENTDELAEKAKGDSSRETDEEKVPSKRSELDSTQPAVNTQQAENSENDAGNEGANGESDADNSGRNSSGEEGQSDESSPDSDNEGSNDPGQGDADNSGDSATKRQIYNEDGEIVDLPEDVDSIVAADEAGAMAVILGGKGILAGTSYSLRNDSIAYNVLGLENVQTYWDGSGSSPMSEDKFQMLLSNKPDVCVYVTGKNSFNGNQLARLKENGIACVALPALNSDENICLAMSLLAEVIGNRTSRGGKNAEKVAKDYEDYCIDLVSSINRNVSETVVTLYLSDWDDNATLLISSGEGNVLVQESGLGVVQNDPSENPLQYYLAAGGVVNNAYELSSYRGKSYAAIPININVHAQNTSVSGGSVELYRPTSGSFARYYGGSGSIGLGERLFPCVVTNSRRTKAALEQSKKYGIWQNFGRVTVNAATDYGFAAYDTLVRTWVRADFQIYVNPYGVTSWADGSAESVLESVWAAYQINGTYSESDVKSEIQNFYQQFYDYSLSDDELQLILAGK